MMTTGADNSRPRPEPMQPAAARTAAFIGAPACGALVGLFAAWLQQFYSPVGIFPLATGVVVGMIVGGIWRLVGLAPRSIVIGSASLAAVVAIVALFYGTFLVARRNDRIAQEKNPEAYAARLLIQQMQRDGATPDEPSEDFSSYWGFVRREYEIGRRLGPRFIHHGELVAWWLGDALLIAAGTILTAAAVARFEPRRPAGSPARGAA